MNYNFIKRLKLLKTYFAYWEEFECLYYILPFQLLWFLVAFLPSKVLWREGSSYTGKWKKYVDKFDWARALIKYPCVTFSIQNLNIWHTVVHEVLVHLYISLLTKMTWGYCKRVTFVYCLQNIFELGKYGRLKADIKGKTRLQ